MTQRSIASSTLAALALGLATASGAHALSIEDPAKDPLTVDLKVTLQARAESVYARGTTSVDGASNGETYITNTESGTKNAQPDPVDFYLKRVRIGFMGAYKATTKFTLMLERDNADRPAAAAGSAASASRGVNVHTAMVARTFKPAEKVTATVRTGIYSAYFNGGNTAPNNELLFAGMRPSTQLLVQRGAGAGMLFDMPYADLGFDIQNNNGEGSQDDAEGLFYSTRLMLSTMNAEGKKQKYTESWAGAPGTGANLVLEAGINDRDVSTPAQAPADAEVKTQQRVYGAELAVHLDGLSALAEYRLREQFVTNGGGKDPMVSRIWLVQAGYALTGLIPDSKIVFEPAARYTRIDLNNKNNIAADEFANYDTNADYAEGSGQQIDAGVNIYFWGHASKLNLGYQFWQAEGGPSELHKGVAQYQLSF